jgi:hypothetical protein
MINREPYKDGDKWTLDVDPDDEVNYVADVRQWLIDNNTEVESFVLETMGLQVLAQGLPQGDRNGLLPVKLKVNFDTEPPFFPHCTFRVTTTDDQQFDKTMWFNQVEN